MKYIWWSLLLLLGSCQPKDCCTIIDTNVGIGYRDAQGRDWLRVNRVTAANMEVYSLHDGVKTRLYNQWADAPKSIVVSISTDTTLSTFTLYPSGTAEANGEALTLLEFPDHSVDTVRCRFENRGSSSHCVNVRYNNRQCWNNQSRAGGRYFKVVK